MDDNEFTKIVFDLFQINGVLIRYGDALTSRFDLTSASWQVLGSIARGDGVGGVTVPQVARRLGQARQSVQRQVNVLSKKGYVSFQDNPNHKRSPLLVLTPDGQEVHDDLERLWGEDCQMWSQILSPDELERARETVVRFRHLLSSAEDEDADT